MTERYEDFSAERIKHLEMIEAVVARLGGNSFLVKGWAVTVAGVLLGLAVNGKHGGVAFAAVVAIVAFWAIDGFFLWAERLFRVLYEEVRNGAAGVEPFWMAATSRGFIQRASARGDAHIGSRWRAILRPTLSGFYVALTAAALLVGALAG